MFEMEHPFKTDAPFLTLNSETVLTQFKEFNNIINRWLTDPDSRKGKSAEIEFINKILVPVFGHKLESQTRVLSGKPSFFCSTKCYS